MKAKSTAFIGALLCGTALAAPAKADLIRIATIPIGAEITGLYIEEEQGDLFMNLQHPATAITGPYNKATVGVIVGADFTALPESVSATEVPLTDYAKQTVQTSIGTYQILAQQGDYAAAIPGGLGAIIALDGTVQKSSNDPDFNGFIPTGPNEGYLFTNWEDRPGGMSRMKIERGEDGRWVVDPEDVMMLDFSLVEGTWVNCFGSVSPWNTPLTSEEVYYDDVENWIDPEAGRDFDDAEATRLYAGGPTNPYDYGYIVEIEDPTGSPTPVKHFAMGRFSHENAVVMPDGRTVYLSDDGTNTVLFKFVADTEGDLTAGTLYAAKVTQDGPIGAAAGETAFDIEWIELAHGVNSEIEAWIDEYDGLTSEDHTEGYEYISDEEIAAWAAGEADDDRVAFLESRKAAAALGATAEWRKAEGIMINHAGMEAGTAPYMYFAMSEVNAGMSDGEGDIAVEANDCGVVYQMAFDDNYSAIRMVPVVAGADYDENRAPNACSVDSISNPDNIVVLEDGRVLIGEDTGDHENNMLWLWSPEA